MSIELAKMTAEASHGLLGGSAHSVTLKSVLLPGCGEHEQWDVGIRDGVVDRIEPVGSHSKSAGLSGAVLAPSLCHPHVHIDKAYLLAHPRYAHLQIEKGDFQEAMDLTAKAKSQFEIDDLLERGQRLIDESVNAGVTHMRAFVEVDAIVHSKCLEAGIELKKRNQGRCIVQICAFAQLPLFTATSEDEHGEIIQRLISEAAENPFVDVIGSTPYVEESAEKMERNIGHLVSLASSSGKHLDFHLDYNLDRDIEPSVWHVVQALKNRPLQPGSCVALGHCTRLALFSDREWGELSRQIKDAGLPISFVGLPSSDLYMMKSGQSPEIRATLNVPKLINQYGLNACFGINNIGNAFTPQGTCDPLGLASQCVGIYQAGSKRDAETLYESVSTRAKAAIGLGNGPDVGLQIRSGQQADMLLFEAAQTRSKAWQTRKSVSEAVYLYDGGRGRTTFMSGKSIS